MKLFFGKEKTFLCPGGQLVTRKVVGKFSPLAWYDQGEITEVKLKELIFEAKQIMDEKTDSFIIFKNRDKSWLNKQVIGKERSKIDQFL